MSYHIAAALLGVIWWTAPVLAEGFLCAGSQGALTGETRPPAAAAKPARIEASTTGARRALVIFAHFKGEPANPVPSWAGDLFNPDLPGSFSHFYDTMSFGKLQVRGEVASHVYESAKSASAYLSGNSSEQGQFGVFAQEILRQADRDIDFAQFDNDGPDGVPNSGDDDGVVDAVFVVLERIPARFLLAEATGIASLGFEGPFATADTGVGGQAMQILPGQGTIQQGRSFAETAGSMCHEYGHVFGLPDLYNTRFLGLKDRRPEDDSAGVGAWCLMGWGATGWNGDDGPNSFSAWSRLQLGWAQVTEVAHPREEMRLSDIGSSGAVYKIPVSEGEYFLLEYRTRQSTYYDRRLPEEGLLIWHARTSPHTNLSQVDLECADGQWLDAGYPQGRQPEPQAGSDNLDFWAHDQAYTARHQGNLGDATDPFDGVRYTAFTPDTNPSSYNQEGTRRVRVEDIRMESGEARAQVQTDSLRLEFEAVLLYDGDGNGLLITGENAVLRFFLHNLGGLTVSGVRTVLSSSDPLVRIDPPEIEYGDVELGYRLRPPRGKTFPKLSLLADPGENRQVPLVLEAFAGRTLVTRHEFSVRVSTSVRWSGRLVDEMGNGVEGRIAIYNLGVSSSITTAPDGTFETNLLPGKYLANVPKNSFASIQYYPVELTADLYSELVLATTYPVSGTIRGSEDQPLAGIQLFTSSPMSNGGSYQGSTSSAPDGTYTLMLARGKYNISITAAPQGWADDGLNNVVVDGPRTLDIGLQRGVRLAVQATGEQGSGSIPGNVSRWTYSGWVTSSSFFQLADGKGVIRLLPGSSSVRLYRFSTVNGRIDGYGVGRLLPIFSDTVVQLTLPQRVPVRGKVADEAVEPYLSTDLSFVPPAHYFSAGAALADDGTYETALPPGHSQVVYTGYEPGRWLQQWVGEISTTGSSTFDVVLQRGERVEGRVVDEEGQGLAGLEIQALSVEAGVQSAFRTREDGTFRVFLQPGAYEFTGIEQGQVYQPLGIREVLSATDLELMLNRGNTLKGQIISGQETALGGAIVVLVQTSDPPLLTMEYNNASLAPQLYHSGEIAGGSISDQEGNYQLRVQPGTYNLVVVPGQGNGIGRVVRGLMLSGDRTQHLRLPAPERAYRLYGQILGESDNTKLILQFFDAGSGVIAQIADSGFRGYGVELPPGRYRVRAGLLSPVGGVQRIYDLGERQVSDDQEWNIDLADAATAVAEETAATPVRFALAPNYPNPFNPTTTIRFSLPQSAEAELSIYNLLGQKVATLVHGVQEAGPQVLQWNGQDEAGRELASGVYLYRLQAGAQVETRKLLLLR